MLGIGAGIAITISVFIGSVLLGGFFTAAKNRTIFAIHREWSFLCASSVGHFVCVFFAIALPELIAHPNNNNNNNNKNYVHSPLSRIFRSLLPLLFLVPLVMRVVRLVCLSAAHHVTVNAVSFRTDDWASTMQAVLHRTRTNRFLSIAFVLTVAHVTIISFLLFVPTSSSLGGNGNNTVEDHCTSLIDSKCLLEPSGRQVFRWGVEWGVDVYELCVWGVGLCVFAWWTSYVRMDGIYLGVELYWSFGIVTSGIGLVWILAQFSPVAANIIVALVGPLNVSNALFWAHRNTTSSTCAHSFSRGIGPHPFLEQPHSPSNRNTHHFTQSIDFRIPARWMQRSSLNVNAENNDVVTERGATTDEQAKSEQAPKAPVGVSPKSHTGRFSQQVSRKTQWLPRPTKSMGATPGSFRMRLSLSPKLSIGSGVHPTSVGGMSPARSVGVDAPSTARQSGFATFASVRISEATVGFLRRLMSTAEVGSPIPTTTTMDNQASQTSIKSKATGKSDDGVDWENLRESTVSSDVLVSISLDMVLKYEPAALAFRQHLCKEFSSENLVAYLEVCKVLEVFETHTLEAIIRSQQLYLRFLCPTSFLQVNIAPTVGETVDKALQDVLKNPVVKKALQVQTTTTKRVTSVKMELYMASVKQRMSAPAKFRKLVEARKSLKRPLVLTQTDVQKHQQQFQQPAKEKRGLISKNSGNKIPKRKSKEPLPTTASTSAATNPPTTATTSPATNPPARDSDDHTNTQRHSWGSAPTQRNNTEPADFRRPEGPMILWGRDQPDADKQRVNHVHNSDPQNSSQGESSFRHSGGGATPNAAVNPAETLSLPPTPNLNSSRSNRSTRTAPRPTPQMNLRLTPTPLNKHDANNGSLPSPTPSITSSRLFLPLSPTPFHALQNSVRNSFSPLPVRLRPPSAPLSFVDNTQLAVLGVSLDPENPDVVALKDSLILMKKRVSALMSQDSLMRFLLGRSFAAVVRRAGIFPWDENGELIVTTTTHETDPTLVLEPPQEPAAPSMPCDAPPQQRALTLEELPHTLSRELGAYQQHDDLQDELHS